MIKFCSNCGKSVSIFTKVGDHCPNCGAVFGYERTDKGSYGNSSYSTKGCLKILLIILLISAALTVPMTLIRHINEKNTAAMVLQLQTGDDEALLTTVEKWMELSKVTQLRIAQMYTDKLIRSSDLEKEKLILRMQKIARNMKAKLKDNEDFMDVFPDEFYDKLQILQNNSDSTISNAAVQTLDSLSVLSGNNFTEFSY